MPKWLKRAGIKIVAISPDLNYAAAIHADKWIPLKPNSDAALYLRAGAYLDRRGNYDKDYVKTHTIGFDEFKRHVMGEDDGIAKTPAWAEKITGVPAHTIRALAREWASKKTTLSVYFGGPKIRGTSVASGRTAGGLCAGDAGHRPPGTAVSADGSAVLLQEIAGAGAALS